MKTLLAALILSVFFCVLPARSEPFEINAKVGFLNNSDRVQDHRILSDNRLLIIGKKNIQIWDYETGKLIVSSPHKIKQFAPRGFFTKYILLGLPIALDWRPYVIESNGKWLITSEKVGKSDLRSAVVRELNSLRTLAILELPGVSAEMIAYDSSEQEITISGKTNKIGAFSIFDSRTFKQKKTFSVEQYKWHHFVKDRKKMIVGSGDTKIDWAILEEKQGESLSLRDVDTGLVEQEYTAPELTPRHFFKHTFVTSDNKYLVSHREDRMFVWEVGGDGQPKFEVTAPAGGALDFVSNLGNGRFAVTYDEKLAIYAVNGDGSPLVTIASDTPDDSIQFMDKTSDGRFVAVRDDWKLAVYDLEKNEKVLQLERDNKHEKIKTAKFFGDSRMMLVSFSNREEKKGNWTEFFSIPDAKPVTSAHVGFSANVEHIGKHALLIDEMLGGVMIWNLQDSDAFYLGLRTWEPDSCGSYEEDCTAVELGEPHNVESVSLSPDGRFLLKYGDKIVSVYDIKTRKELVRLFDPEQVKYSKKTSEVKKSGLGDAGWTPDGRYVYALDSKSRKVIFWNAE